MEGRKRPFINRRISVFTAAESPYFPVFRGKGKYDKKAGNVKAGQGFRGSEKLHTIPVMGKKEGENVYILATSISGGQFYIGKCFQERGKKRPALTYMIERAKKYKTMNAAIKASNALVEKCGCMLFVVDAADFEGRIDNGIRSPDPRS